jgi:hypothetical protein
MAKHEAINLLTLYSLCDTNQWNEFLTQCFRSQDISTLIKTRYGLQVGMNDLVKQKLNSEKMIQFFLRLERSIEKTITKIVREKTPNPCDNPLLASHSIEFKDEKNKRDNELELFLRKSGY